MRYRNSESSNLALRSVYPHTRLWDNIGIRMVYTHCPVSNAESKVCRHLNTHLQSILLNCADT
ncbi:Uncharacterized protein APZ42_015645 [Daphnia magna]|uniref:Uncharacterized protein n=1 Tax=Daphnia magna TaxID=35525 RepID=A0A162NRQ4_9CRUS|nr:Uncharacterized protein APZ42_015645 [Daphnia magna]